MGAISGILALMISGAQIWHDVTRAPDTVAFNGASVDLSYDPVQRQITFQFPLLLRNGGSIDDVLQGMRARLNNITTWDARHISVTENGPVIVARVTPFGVPLGSSQLSFSLSSLQDGALAAGNNRIELTLQTSQNELPVGYCFDLTDVQLSEMRQSVQIWTRTMTTVECRSPGREGKST